jgi:hypothetical protein
VDPDTGKFTLIRLKAENREERDEWFECLKRAIAPYAMKKNTMKDIDNEEQKQSYANNHHLKSLINKQKSITLN